MRVMVAKNESQWIDLAWTWLHNEVKAKQSVFMPAGGTPTPFYRRLCAERSDLFASLRLLQLDEVISGPKRGIFRSYFEQELAPFKHQFEWIGEGESTADACILGVGLNGHVAFHEPQLPRQFFSGCVPLSQETLNALSLSQPTWGLTYGVDAFLRSKKVLVLAQGEAKQRVLKSALANKSLPIYWMLEHPHCTVLTNFDL